MTAQRGPRRRRRWFLGGCTLAASSSLGLCAFPLLANALARHDLAVFSIMCGLAVLTGLGAMVAVFNMHTS